MVELGHLPGVMGDAATVVGGDNTAVAMGSGSLPIFATPALAAPRRIRADTLGQVREPAPPPPMQQLASQRQRSADLMFSMKQLTGESAAPRTTQVTRITLDDDIHLLIRTDRLRHLGLDGADALGRAITASIIDLITAKGGKPS